MKILTKIYMPKDIKLNLAYVLNYMKDAEEKNYLHWFEDNAIIDAEDSRQPATHIYESVMELQAWLDKQSI